MRMPPRFYFACRTLISQYFIPLPSFFSSPNFFRGLPSLSGDLYGIAEMTALTALYGFCVMFRVQLSVTPSSPSPLRRSISGGVNIYGDLGFMANLTNLYHLYKLISTTIVHFDPTAASP